MIEQISEKTPEWRNVDLKTFENQIVTQYKPAILKGLVKDWPSVQYALKSPELICRYLMQLDNGNPIDTILIPPEAKGRMFYREDMRGLNFARHKLPVSVILNQLAAYSKLPNPPSLAAQCALVQDCVPGFFAENRLPLLDESIPPRIWLGNFITTPAHFDGSENLACVVSGRRRFTLFPPEQIPNLYIGPVDFGPTATPISMVSFKDPDFERFPRFKQAIEAAQVAELEPGDALYLPNLWWHHVESLDPLSIQVNFWWNTTIPGEHQTSNAFECMMHCIKNMRNLSPEHKEAWGAIFKHYVFETAYDPAAHIPEHCQGILKKALQK